MIEPEDPAEKNEQELNLFADQSRTDVTPAAPDNANDIPEVPAPDHIPTENVSAEETVPASPEPEASPVIAPPPPTRKPAAVRPGIVSGRTGQTAFPASAPSTSSSASTHKPLPHPLQESQTLGQMLTAIRTARGLSLGEVALSTRIRLEYLSELESDELLKVLPHVYVSAYVRKLIEVYDLSKADAELLIEKMQVETTGDAEEIPEKLIESVNDGALVNEGENKRIRNITIVFFTAIGIVAAAILWLVILVVVHYVKTSTPSTAPSPAGVVQPAEAPASQTILLDESELDALIVPETPSISVLKMNKVPGVRDTP